MSVKDLNKIINVSNAFNGQIEFTFDFDDFVHNPSASDYFYSKIYELIENENGCVIKIGYKS